MFDQWKRSFFISAVIVSVVGILGCATIITDSYQMISVTSAPSGAEVSIYNRANYPIASGKTPMRAHLDKGAGFFSAERYRLEINKAGYQPVQASITARPSGWYLAGNVVFGGLIGWLIVDPATGAMWVLTPEHVYENLSATTAEETLDNSNPHDLHIVFRKEVPEKLSGKLDNFSRYNLVTK